MVTLYVLSITRSSQKTKTKSQPCTYEAAHAHSTARADYALCVAKYREGCYEPTERAARALGARRRPRCTSKTAVLVEG